ncbi:hypothetical protein GCM10011531_28120 [Aquaticitalea lipolytica]|uniref:Uncharacterized protein n=1 Tax=Aquaticitalea lipolytica TaxID=1247562 RepID=A0A8J2TSB0_9FLAO|nr:hypothetical protein [Aquaticitalea lipolytica]GFZ94792.1 hypothetical protein GCM10011531_28120 [Aquaticitalea lipolytica]
MNKIIIFLIFSPLCFSQNIDPEKVSKISNIICECLEENKEDVIADRIDNCSFVLTKGLSVIKSDSIRNKYARDTDTYLQKNCYEYIRIISDSKSNSGQKLTSIEDFNNAKSFQVHVNVIQENSFYYTDFIGDTILVYIKKNNFIEKITSSGKTINFKMGKKGKDSYLIFKESNDIFFSNYFDPKEKILVRSLKVNDRSYDIFLQYENGIVMQKTLRINNQGIENDIND